MGEAPPSRGLGAAEDDPPHGGPRGKRFGVDAMGMNGVGDGDKVSMSVLQRSRAFSLTFVGLAKVVRRFGLFERTSWQTA